MINLTSYQHHFLIYVTLGCSATRRRQCSLFLLVSDFFFSSHHPSLSLLPFPLNITNISSAPSHPLTLSFITVSGVSERLTRLPLLLFLLSLSVLWRIDRWVRVLSAQERNTRLKGPFKALGRRPLPALPLRPFTFHPPSKTNRSRPPAGEQEPR